MSEQKTKLIAVVAIDEAGVIGNKGKLPWHLPEDLKWFKKTTQGHAVLMGRKTYESIGKPLPNRTNIVLSRTMEPKEGITVIREIKEAFSMDYPQIFVIGGAEIYKALLPELDQLLITHVEGKHEGDTFFPEYLHLFEKEEDVEKFSQAKVVSYKRKER